MSVKMTRAKQRGVAIVLAISVVAVAAVLASAIAVTLSTWSRQRELAAHHAQAQAVIRAGVDWARSVLSDDRRLGSVDHLGEAWALRLAPIPVDNGQLAGFIEDQQGAFNLNNVVKDGKVNLAQLDCFRRLLSILALPTTLAGALVDWIDADSEAQSSEGAEDPYYLAMKPPYLAANRPLIDVAELALVRGFDADVVARLRPFVTALPGFTAVNVNTATPEVLAALVDGLTLDAARQLVAQRDRIYFVDNADFAARLPRGAVVAIEAIAVSSEYFTAIARATIGGVEARGVALLERKGPRWPTVVWRKYL
jgi:general secretion pathway protein K